MRVNAFILLMMVPSLVALEAQRRSPADGDKPTSLGQPGLWRYSAGGALGGGMLDGTGGGLGEARATLSRDLLNPLLGLAALQLEPYAGARGGEWDGGLRGRLSLPILRAAIAADYNLLIDRTRWMLSFMRSLRRGGLFHDGTVARVDIGLGRDWSVAFGFDKPFQRRIPAGRTRPTRDYVPLEATPIRAPTRALAPDVAATLDEVREYAEWIGRFTAPWLEHQDTDHAKAESLVVGRIELMRSALSARQPDGSTRKRIYETEVRQFHGAVAKAFALAVRDSSAWTDTTTTAVVRKARTVLLDEVLLPYDRLLGQVKRDESTREFARRARDVYRRWIFTASGLSADAGENALAVFTVLLDIVESNRKAIQDLCHDSRFVWLPLQYALLPEDHDSQAELDALVERAVGDTFKDGNFVSYVINEQFQVQLARTIRDANKYHVLWIHDVRGVDTHGNPDEMAFREVTQAYLSTLTKRVRDYDRTGTIPTYLILIDEWFYRVNKGHIYLSLLEDPLGHRTKLPGKHAAWEDSIAKAQELLRQAVAESRLLQEQRVDRGDDWLRSVVKVQVNVTNAADQTFWSRKMVKGLSVSDNMYRDHRKLVFYDLTEADPYEGEAMYTGAGVGEHYSNLSWEDRTLLVSGPAALQLKTAARELLRSQGVDSTHMPWHLQQLPKAADYDEKVRSASAGSDARRALSVHNAVGFGDKNVNVTKAVLYTLMPSGSVIKIPDSLWNSDFWGAALIGSALRGVRVLIIAPARENAPAVAFGSMQNSYELLWRLIAVSQRMAPELKERGGLLRVGLYDSELKVTDIAGKASAVQAAFRKHEWLRTLFALKPSVFDGLQSLITEITPQLDSLDQQLRALADSGEYEAADRPRLHLKSNTFASREAWQVLTIPEWEQMMGAFVQYRLAQVQDRASALRTLTDTTGAFKVNDGFVNNWFNSLDDSTRKRVVFYNVMGSQNQNARSMVMDGEVALVISAWPSVIPYIDLIAIIGQSEWPEDPSELHHLLPPWSQSATRLAHWFRYLF